MGHERGTTLLDRFPDDATDAWRRLLRDVVGGGVASSPLIAALDRPVGPLLDGVDVDAALDAEDEATSRCAADGAALQPVARETVSVGA